MNRTLLCPAGLATAALLCGAAPARPHAIPPVTVSAPKATDASDLRSTPASRHNVRVGHRHSRGATPASVRRVSSANRAATHEPTRQGFIEAVQVFPYAEGALYHVVTAPGQVTDIALQPGEALGAVAAGDTVRWVIGDTTSGSGETKTTHVLVKPFASGLTTNLVITTDRRVYHLSLTSTAQTAMTALSWVYPQDQLIALQKAALSAEAAAPVASGLAIEQLHFNYAVSGDKPDWRPLRAFDDGRQTFIEFRPDLATGTAPPLFVVGPNGAAELVNYRVRGHFYVVDRLFDAAELRFGLKRQQVVRITRIGGTQRRAS